MKRGCYFLAVVALLLTYGCRKESAESAYKRIPSTSLLKRKVTLDEVKIPPGTKVAKAYKIADGRTVEVVSIIKVSPGGYQSLTLSGQRDPAMDARVKAALQKNFPNMRTLKAVEGKKTLIIVFKFTPSQIIAPGIWLSIQGTEAPSKTVFQPLPLNDVQPPPKGFEYVPVRVEAPLTQTAVTFNLIQQDVQPKRLKIELREGGYCEWETGAVRILSIEPMTETEHGDVSPTFRHHALWRLKTERSPALHGATFGFAMPGIPQSLIVQDSEDTDRPSGAVDRRGRPLSCKEYWTLVREGKQADPLNKEAAPAVFNFYPLETQAPPDPTQNQKIDYFMSVDPRYVKELEVTVDHHQQIKITGIPLL